jgi:polyphosphate kinase
LAVSSASKKISPLGPAAASTPVPVPAATAPSLDDPSLYLNREMSLLAFQRRVLDEARDPDNPLLERVKFLSIFSSNLDEFFMVRVAVLKQKEAASPHDSVVAGQLDRIAAEVKRLFSEAYVCWNELSEALAQEGVVVSKYLDLDPEEQAWLETYFHEVIYPVLTPLAFDPGRPFPHISNLSLNLAVVVRDQSGRERFARVKSPDTLPQLVKVSATDRPAGKPKLIWLEQVITHNVGHLFPGLEIIAAYPFRIIRDAEVELQELESDDLLESIEEAVRLRRFSDVVQLQVAQHIPDYLLKILLANLELDSRDVYSMDGPVDLSRLKQISSIDRPDLKDIPFTPQTPLDLRPKAEDDPFTVIKRGDILLHHPFEAFQPVAEFVRRAADDPDVLAIKMTLYRVGQNSPIVESLLHAMENGKQVAVLMELKARFDEESNIEWARALEAAGVHVVYGLVGLKVHSKVALVVRREGETIRRYVHLGTGNYNVVTARLYTDLSFLTADEEIGEDVTDLFNFVTGYSAKKDFNKLLVAPINLRSKLEALIRREIDCAARGERAHLILKMNALEDHGMIRLLYEASRAGVQVDLLVRGICCLRPGVEGVSDNIRVSSIVGRFLEHSRIYYFRNGGDEQIYAGSADFMGRNLDRRVEVLFPVQDPRLIARLRDEILAQYLADNRNARHMLPDGAYTWEKPGRSAKDSQARFLKH